MSKFANKNRRAYSVLIQQIHDLQRSDQELNVSSLFIIIYSRNKLLLPGVEQISSVCGGAVVCHCDICTNHVIINLIWDTDICTICIYNVVLEKVSTRCYCYTTSSTENHPSQLQLQLRWSFSSPAPALLQPFVCLEQPHHPSSSDDVNAMPWHCVPVISEKSKQKFSPFSIIWAGLQTREDGREFLFYSVRL